MKGIHLLAACLLLGGMIQLTGCATAIGAGASSTTLAALDRRSAGTIVDDQIIELKILSAIGQNKRLAELSHINVTSYNNMVLLSGEIPDKDLKRQAAQIAGSAHPKVRGIYNELSLAAPSSLLSRSSDLLVTGKVKSSLIAKNRLKARRVKVVTENGTVFLLGLVTKNEGRRATEATRRVGGVQRVVKLFEYIN